MTRRKNSKIIAFCLLAVVLAACDPKVGKESVLQMPLPAIQQIYTGHGTGFRASIAVSTAVAPQSLPQNSPFAAPLPQPTLTAKTVTKSVALEPGYLLVGCLTGLDKNGALVREPGGQTILVHVGERLANMMVTRIEPHYLEVAPIGIKNAKLRQKLLLHGGR